MFNHPVQGGEVVAGFLSLRHGSTSVVDYSIQYHILATDNGWNDARLRGVYIKVLGKQLKDNTEVHTEVYMTKCGKALEGRLLGQRLASHQHQAIPKRDLAHFRRRPPLRMTPTLV